MIPSAVLPPRNEVQSLFVYVNLNVGCVLTTQYFNLLVF